jgi:hypothetical protein
LDVTADVAAFLEDTANHGWVVRPRVDSVFSEVRLHARASASPPVLVLTLQGDTTPPPIPDGFDAPDSAEALLVMPPGQDSVLVLRDFVSIGFFDSTSGAAINSVLSRYAIRIAGGFPRLRTYIVQVSDPGPTYVSLDSLLSAISSEPGVEFAARIVFRAPVRNPSRFPVDDPQYVRREDWLGLIVNATDGTRALRVIRAQLAWGCENGLYRSDTVTLGVLDEVFDPALQDLAPSFALLHSASALRAVGPAITGSAALSHGTAVAGVLTARGDNGAGVAGLVWQSALHLFRLSREDGGATKQVIPRPLAIADAIAEAATTPVRVLVSSVEDVSDSVMAKKIALEIADFVNTPPGRIFVQAGQN